MEDNLNFLVIWKKTQILRKMEDDLNFELNGRRPEFKGKWKMTSLLGEMEDNLNFWAKLKRTSI
jgi:hypothetical protein